MTTIDQKRLKALQSSLDIHGLLCDPGMAEVVATSRESMAEGLLEKGDVVGAIVMSLIGHTIATASEDSDVTAINDIYIRFSKHTKDITKLSKIYPTRILENDLASLVASIFMISEDLDEATTGLRSSLVELTSAKNLITSAVAQAALATQAEYDKNFLLEVMTSGKTDTTTGKTSDRERGLLLDIINKTGLSGRAKKNLIKMVDKKDSRWRDTFSVAATIVIGVNLGELVPDILVDRELFADISKELGIPKHAPDVLEATTDAFVYVAKVIYGLDDETM